MTTLAAAAAFLAVPLTAAADFWPPQEPPAFGGTGVYATSSLSEGQSPGTGTWGAGVLLAQLEAPTDLQVLEPGQEPPPPPSGGGGMKWHPGHYAHVGNADLSAFESDVGHYRLLKGYQKRYYWNDLEPQRGKYGFGGILQDLQYAKSKGKYLFIQLQFKSFNNQKYAPAYLLTSEFDGGVYEAKTGGWNLRLWDAKVLQRFRALLTALGEALDTHQALAGVNLAESAAGAPAKDSPLNANWNSLKQTHAENLAESGVTLARAFPTTPTLLYFNGGPADVPDLRNAMLSGGVGIGGPDTYIGALEHDLWLQHTYRLAQEFAGTVPVGYAVQWHNYTRVGGTSKWEHPDGAVPVEEIYEFSRTVLGSSFMFWAKRNPYWNNVKSLWQEIGESGDPAGGLDDRCPTMLRPCST